MCPKYDFTQWLSPYFYLFSDHNPASSKIPMIGICLFIHQVHGYRATCYVLFTFLGVGDKKRKRHGLCPLLDSRKQPAETPRDITQRERGGRGTCSKWGSLPICWLDTESITAAWAEPVTYHNSNWKIQQNILKVLPYKALHGPLFQFLRFFHQWHRKSPTQKALSLKSMLPTSHPLWGLFSP